MKLLRRGWRRFVGTLAAHRTEGELADEIASHIEMQVEDNLRAGMAPEEARRAARLKFGSTEGVKELCRDQRGLPWMEALFWDLRFALRGLRHSPGFTFVVVLTLALGIGAITAVFSLVDKVLLTPPGIRNPERVIAVQTIYRNLNSRFPIVSPQTLADLQDSPEVFEHAALMSPADVNYTTGGDPQRLRGAIVTSEWFDVFGAKPYLGRTFRKDEDQPNANGVVVLSHGAWTRLFGADPAIIGRSIDLNQAPRRVIGVMPPEFRWPRNVDLWAPAGLPSKAFGPAARFGTESFTGVARTRQDVSFRQAKEWMGILTERVRSAGGAEGAIARNYGWSLSAIPFRDTVAGDTRTPLLVLLGAVVLVLLIVCSNVAGLLLARGSARDHEFAVRAALGARRGQMLRSLLTESLLLAIAGGLAGLLLADYGVNLLLMMSPSDVAAGIEQRMDHRVTLFCAMTALTSALLFGLAPAWQISRIGPNGTLTCDDRGSTAGRGRQRMRSALVVVETALALMLLVAGGLLFRSFVLLLGVNPGFEPRGVMTAVFTLPPKSYPSEREQSIFSRAVLARLKDTQGVATAALGTPPPFSGLNNSDVFQIEGRVMRPVEPLPFGDERLVTPGYFRTLGIPLRRGRDFSQEDRPGGELVTVIDENLAREYWPGTDPVGSHIIWKGGTYRIVGIVGHVMHSDLATDSGKGVYYFDMFQRPTPFAAVLVKTQGDVANMATAIREAVREADPLQAVHSFLSMEDSVANSLAPRRFGVRLLGFFAGTALFLTALGLYGVISYSVTQRRREIGIRMALGAERKVVTKLVVGQGLRLAVLGVGIGIIGSISFARVIQNQLFGVSAFDPLTIAGMAAVLLAVSMLASLLPVWRAMRADPVMSLRAE
jgi:predicted permease